MNITRKDIERAITKFRTLPCGFLCNSAILRITAKSTHSIVEAICRELLKPKKRSRPKPLDQKRISQILGSTMKPVRRPAVRPMMPCRMKVK